MPAHLSCQVQIWLLLADKVYTKVSPKYSKYADDFLFDLAIELPENTGTNEYTNELVEGKQPYYSPIFI